MPTDETLDVDLAAMRSVTAMLAAYDLSPEDADRAATDIIAKLRLGGFVIAREYAATPPSPDRCGVQRFVGQKSCCLCLMGHPIHPDDERTMQEALDGD